jgi:c-di-GMP-binding flagellar brake protein YcgR
MPDSTPPGQSAVNAAPSHGNAATDDFRITTEVEIRGYLKQLCDEGALMTLTSADGESYTSRIWTFDSHSNVVSFAADPHDSRLQALTESDEVTAVGYLSSVKLQFDLGNLMLVRNGKQSALHARFPKEIFRFQRRGNFRVRPVLPNYPVARFFHPNNPELPLALRVLDVSVGGCALFMPNDVEPILPGIDIEHVRIELDADTRILVKLRMHHITAINPESKGVRLGTEMLNMSAEVERILIRFVDQTQRRRRFLARE